jgi:hypothetical protein
VKKLCHLLAAALLVFSAASVNAGSLASADVRPGLGSTQPLAGWCYIYMNGRWYQVPC